MNIFKRDINMALKPNTINTTISILQVFNHLKHSIMLAWVWSFLRCMSVIIVVKFSFGVCLTSSFKSLTNIIIYFGPWTVFDDCMILIMDWFVHYIPLNSVVPVSFHHRFNEWKHVLLKLGSICLVFDKIRIVVWRPPNKHMHTYLLIMLLGELD